ncbi:monovalent cation/H+ antiporter complex subunit F [Parafrankia irregularis]|uniref:monovalent cation/H+ antiporter complex subunit F n=1 Tax=Parafrankia irregularis TaxID=795642 RepID=UPI000DF228CB|nr:monovalent cation/H+ antiporter complex subunit F [Parafrankia irregularis]MBE3199463.1 hypothetical protein [Parafrankia sp. CH37]
MTAVYTATFVLLSVAGLLTLARLLVGPTDLDRIVALDVLVILIVAGVTVEIGMRREGWNIALVAVVSLLGFLGSATAAAACRTGCFRHDLLVMDDLARHREQQAAAVDVAGDRTGDRRPPLRRG